MGNPSASVCLNLSKSARVVAGPNLQNIARKSKTTPNARKKTRDAIDKMILETTSNKSKRFAGGNQSILNTAIPHPANANPNRPKIIRNAVSLNAGDDAGD